MHRQVAEVWRGTGAGTRAAYVSIRQHTSAYVSIFEVHRQVAEVWRGTGAGIRAAYVSIRQHTSAYVRCTVKSPRCGVAPAPGFEQQAYSDDVYFTLYSGFFLLSLLALLVPKYKC